MNDTMSIPIDRLMTWCTGCWTNYETKTSNITLRIIYDQLLITSDNKILETLNVNRKMKGIYKDDVLILILSKSAQEVRKLKFRIKTDVPQCLERLAQHFLVLSHNSAQSKNVICSRYHDIEQVLKAAVETMEDNQVLSLPPSYNNFVRLCLLDPTFPQLVLDTQKVLDNDILKKKS